MLAILVENLDTNKHMANFLNEFDRARRTAAENMQRQKTADEREKQRAEQETLDEQYAHDTALRTAVEKAVKERQITLDWAWAAAELLNESGAQPDVWTHTYIQPKGFFGFGRVAVQGIAAEGWPLLDWQNTRYEARTRHSLLLTPRDRNNSGIHLQYFSRSTPFNGSTPDLQPNEVHELSRIPLSAEDMPWPGIIDPSQPEDWIDQMNGTKKQIALLPWKESFSVTFDGFDADKDMDEMLMEIGGHPTPRSAGVDDYTEYRRTKTEEAIRSAIAQVAARHTIVKPQELVERAQSRSTPPTK